MSYGPPGGMVNGLREFPHKHGTLTYPGDVAGHALGQIVGPDVVGRIFTITDAVYDPETDRTRVELDEYRPHFTFEGTP